MMKASKEHTIVSNFINREFKQDIPYKVLLTDITYLSYKNGKKASTYDRSRKERKRRAGKNCCRGKGKTCQERE